MSKYILNIDWLALYGTQSIPLDVMKFTPRDWHAPDESDQIMELAAAVGANEVDHYTAAENVKRFVLDKIELEVMPYGTRQFYSLYQVYYRKELFAQIQLFPKLPSMPKDCMIMKIANLWLYRANWLNTFDYVCTMLRLQPLKISRLDLAADFNTFENSLHPIEFIRQFMAGEIKHKGRGAGAVNFEQRYAYLRKEDRIVDVLAYNALTMGKKASDAHCYLYNKTLELQTAKCKPYIWECWQRAGFDCSDVWRLEVTMGAKALDFYDRNTGDRVKFGISDITKPSDDMNIAVLYFAMLRALFFFFVPTGQKNVSREKMIRLFGDSVEIDRAVIRSWQCSGRTEKVLIKQLYTLAQRYRGVTDLDQTYAAIAADHLVESCGLQDWLKRKKDDWKNIRLKE